MAPLGRLPPASSQEREWTAADDQALRDAYVVVMGAGGGGDSDSEDAAASAPASASSAAAAAPQWTDISARLHGRTAKQCRDRWLHFLRPSLGTRKWSEEEDALIFQQLLLIGNRWTQIAAMLVGRTSAQVKNRYYSACRRIGSHILTPAFGHSCQHVASFCTMMRPS